MPVDNLVFKKEGESSLATWIKRRIKRNQNCILNTEGPTGSGKSYADMGIAYEIDPEFDEQKQIVFSFTEFMKLLNDEEFMKKKYKQIIFEEFQVSASNRNWQSLMNKSINYIFSTFRHQNIILYINAPYRDFLDSQTMKMIHLVLQTRGIDRKKKVVKVRPLIQEYNSKMKKTYEHSIYSRGLDKKVRKLFLLNVKKPPKEMCDKYEERKSAFTSKLNKDIMEEAIAYESKSTPKQSEEGINDLTGEESMIYEYIKENPNKYRKDYAKELNINESKLGRKIKKIQYKGVDIRKYLKKLGNIANFPQYKGKSIQKGVNSTHIEGDNQDNSKEEKGDDC